MSESSVSFPATVAARAEAVIRDVLGLETDSIPGSSRLREDLGADSDDAVMLVMAIERQFNGKISDEVVACVNRRIGEQGLS